jgi:hypothetical protein
MAVRSETSNKNLLVIDTQRDQGYENNFKQAQKKTGCTAAQLANTWVDDVWGDWGYRFLRCMVVSKTRAVDNGHTIDVAVQSAALGRHMLLSCFHNLCNSHWRDIGVLIGAFHPSTV